MLWSSQEFGFCELPDAWTAGSSIMPQKKNPDAAELLRAKAPRVVGHLAALHGVLHALPLTYNKDLQEDKEHLFDAADTLALELAAARGFSRACASTASGSEAAADEMIAAIELADPLVRRGVLPAGAWRGRRARARATAAAGRSRSSPPRSSPRRRALRSPPRTILARCSRRFRLESKGSAGGTARERFEEQLTARARAAAPDARWNHDFYARDVRDVARRAARQHVVRHGECAGLIVE